METGGVQTIGEPHVGGDGPVGPVGPGNTAPTARARGRSAGRRAQVILRRFGAIGALVILLLVAEGLNPNFLTADNIRAQLQIFCLNAALIAVGETLVILTGGIDLSVGSLLAVGSCLAGVLVGDGTTPSAPLILVFLLPIALTTILGGVSGTIIAKARVQPIVVTLAMSIAARGVAQLITGGGGRGHTINVGNTTFNNLAITPLGPLPVIGVIPVSVVLIVIVFALAALFLTRTAQGRYVFAVGGNERAARLSGVAADRVKIVVYAVSGLLAGLAGVLFASYNATSDPFNDGLYYELQAISAVVVGGTSLLGGVGGVWRTLIGGLILTVLNALIIQVGLQRPAQLIVQGLIIAGAVILQGGGES